MVDEEIPIKAFLHLVGQDDDLLIHHRFRDGPPSPLGKVDILSVRLAYYREVCFVRLSAKLKFTSF